jgi:hypothetical protein
VIASHRVFLMIAVLATAASMLGAPLAHAGSLMHSSGNRSTIGPQERSRHSDRHLPFSHRAPPQQQVVDPFADLFLG